MIKPTVPAIGLALWNVLIDPSALNINSFYSLLHAQLVISVWMLQYNHDRRHSSLGISPQLNTLKSAPTH